jgi:integrase
LRWRFTRNAYYYQVRDAERPYFDDKQTFRLGSTLAVAHKEYSKRLESMPAEEREQEGTLRTVVQLLDKYLEEVTPTKSKRTQVDEPRYVRNLKKFFGGPPPALIVQMKARHAYQYVNWRIKLGGGKRAARLEFALLSHAFTKAIRWGVQGLDVHPFIDKVRFDEADEKTQGRDRYIEDWERDAALSLKSRRKKGSVRMIQAYIRVKELTGLRRTDMLKLKIADLQEEGIKVRPQKTTNTTGHKKLIEWSDELRAAVEEAKKARPVDIAPWLFCNEEGECYLDEDDVASGFDSIWQRFMTRLLKETDVTERFQERDIRGKTGSDSESDLAAQKLLGHANVNVTRKHYRRKGEKVKPLR